MDDENTRTNKFSIDAYELVLLAIAGAAIIFAVKSSRAGYMLGMWEGLFTSACWLAVIGIRRWRRPKK